ncbi:MAG: RHS repeat-associated core domain-containing protein [Desulfuromonadales bacterium]|nr:RHS repeat-associated core domain-containing protein [Desulfuromonadales bacterium]
MQNTVSTSQVHQLRFPGQYYDAETGLNYNYFRDYNPNIGRYVEADPIGIKSGENHLYGYVENNPIKYIDPNGLDAPGCDSVPGACETPCVLECCADHDKCYDDNNCKASSWLPYVGTKECKKCNSDVKKCILKCGRSKKDDPNKPNYYCCFPD